MKVKKDARFKEAYRMGKHERAVYLEEHPENRDKINRLVRGTRFSWEAPAASLLLTPFLILYIFLFQDGFQTSGLTWTLAGTFLGALWCNICVLVLPYFNKKLFVLDDFGKPEVVRVICALAMPVITSIYTNYSGFYDVDDDAKLFILVWSIAWIVVYIALCSGDILLEFHPNTIIVSVIAAVILLVSLFFTSSWDGLAIGIFSFYGVAIICLIIVHIAEKLYWG